jgi:hypothetical protein
MSDPREPLDNGGGDLAEEIETDADAERQGDGDAGDARTDADRTEDEGADAEEDEEEVDGEPAAAQPRRGRAAETISTLRRERREAREELARFREDSDRRLRELEQRVQRPDPEAAQRAEREWNERLALMGPEERERAWYDRGQREYNERLARTQFDSIERQDIREFQALQREDRNAARLAPRVEEILRQRRQNGQYDLLREQILNYLVGEEVRTRSRALTPGQRRDAQDRVRRQTTRPGRAAGDVAPQRTRSGGDDIAAVRERLRGQAIF